MKAKSDSGPQREGFGQASLGEAQSSNPPADPEMIEDEGGTQDTEPEGTGMNRFFRRMIRFGKRSAARRSKGLAADTSGKLTDPSTPADVTSVRAKSQRHRKSTADKWNQ
jgi:hypothetical protein